MNDLSPTPVYTPFRIAVGKELFEETHRFSFWEMHPLVKVCIYVILAYVPALSKLQQRIRNSFGNNELLLDIREAKPPKFSTLVKGAEEVQRARNIFDKYFAVHGILIDSFSDLFVYIYAPKDTELQPDNKDIVEEGSYLSHALNTLDNKNKSIAVDVVNTAQEVRKSLSSQGIILDLDFLLCIMDALGKFATDELKQPYAWIRSDGCLQRFVRRIRAEVQNKLTIRIDYEWENGFSTKLFRDMERLIHMGLLDHVHKLVGYPEKKESGPRTDYVFRIDRKISGWGKGYVDAELENIEIYSDIYKTVEASQKKVGEKLIEFLDMEQRIRDLGSNLSERGKVNKQLEELRRKIIKRGGCIYTI